MKPSLQKADTPFIQLNDDYIDAIDAVEFVLMEAEQWP